MSASTHTYSPLHLHHLQHVDLALRQQQERHQNHHQHQQEQQQAATSQARWLMLRLLLCVKTVLCACTHLLDSLTRACLYHRREGLGLLLLHVLVAAVRLPAVALCLAWDWVAGALELMITEESFLCVVYPSPSTCTSSSSAPSPCAGDLDAGHEGVFMDAADLEMPSGVEDLADASGAVDVAAAADGLEALLLADSAGFPNSKPSEALLDCLPEMSETEKIIFRYLEEAAGGFGQEALPPLGPAGRKKPVKSKRRKRQQAVRAARIVGQPVGQLKKKAAAGIAGGLSPYADNESESGWGLSSLGAVDLGGLSSLWRGLGARAAWALGLVDDEGPARGGEGNGVSKGDDYFRREANERLREEGECAVLAQCQESQPQQQQPLLPPPKQQQQQQQQQQPPPGWESLVWQTKREAEESERGRVMEDVGRGGGGERDDERSVNRACSPPHSVSAQPLVAPCADAQPMPSAAGPPAGGLFALVDDFPPTLLPCQASLAGSGGSGAVHERKQRKTLVLDLDETLVHSVFEPAAGCDYSLTVHLEPHGPLDVYVRKRPGVDAFLAAMAARFEVVVFTASLQRYADPLLDLLDPGRRLVSHRLFRDSCSWLRGSFVKDLSCLGRDLADVVIVDNSPAAFALQPENGVAVASFYDDGRDRELAALTPFLEALADAEGDVRNHIARRGTARAAADGAGGHPFWAWGTGSGGGISTTSSPAVSVY